MHVHRQNENSCLTYFRYPQDPEARALIVGLAVVAIYAVDAGSNVKIWPATQAPHCECPGEDTTKFEG